jgi:molybdate transport system substrate-binding protein
MTTKSKGVRHVVIVTLLFWMFSGVACSHRNASNTERSVTIVAAADLKFAIEEAIQKFKSANPQIEIKAIYGSSGSFFAQINNNAPFDMFLSADVEYPQKLVNAGLAIPGTEFSYAVGRLVVWARKDSPIDVERRGVESLLDPSVHKISIANPEHAPYGRAAVAAMQRLGVYAKIKDRFVFGESVAQALEFIDSGAAETGIVAMSLAVAPTVKPRGRYAELPLDSYPRMNQGGVILKAVKDRKAAEAFRSFLMDVQGRAILKQFGFYLPQE